MMLNYYKGDYTRTGSFLNNAGTGSGANINMNNLYAQANTSGDAPDLFNGNISSWVQSQLNQSLVPVNTRTSLYKYDALNRIKQSAELEQNGTAGWSNLAAGAATFKTSYTYDANGNILGLNRFDQNGTQMDQLSYTYDNGAQGTALHKNQLTSVIDNPGITGVNGRGDLEGTHNYTYDAIGNLVGDVSQERMNLGSGYQVYTIQTDITWTVYGKIKAINKTVQGQNKQETISFAYDASGNRTQKRVTGNMHPEQTTFYVRDAQGNTMSIYIKGEDPLLPGQTSPSYSYSLIEQPIYGSSRIGENIRRVQLSTANTLQGLTPPGDGLNAISEYQNWITTTNKAHLFPGDGATDQLCECKINSIQGANYNQVGAAEQFLGIAENGVAVAENLKRELQFYVVLAKKYLGNKNACLVYDKNGKLMKGTEIIGSMDPESKPVIVSITGSNKYAIVTLNEAHLPVYHIVDMDKAGYAGVDAAGEVITANLSMTNYGTAAPRHGWHFTGYEDHINNKTIVYSSRYTPDNIETYKGTTEIVAYDFGNNFTAQPTEHILYTIEGCGNSEAGELQISPNGDKLLWYQHGARVSGFDHRLGDIYTINLGSDKLSISATPSFTSTTPGGNYGKGMAEFMKNNDDILFSQRGLYKEAATAYDKNVWKYTKVGNQLATINPFTSPDITYLFSEIKRGVDGNYYMPNMGEKAEKVHTYSGAAFNTDLTLSANNPDYKLASALPTQVYKLYATSSVLPQGRSIDDKVYELNDHLGNVRVVITDMKLAVDDGTYIGGVKQNSTPDGIVDFYQADVVAAYDYYAGVGQLMPGRIFEATDYRYGAQGSEVDKELNGTRNTITTFYREGDLRKMQWDSPDPKANASESPYVMNHNNGVLYNDPEGDCPPGSPCFEAKASLALTFGTSGQSRINFGVGAGASQTTGNFMGGANLSLNLFNGGLGTTQGATGKNSFGGALTFGVSGTFGSGTGTPTTLNNFNSSTLSGVTNNFKNSFSVGTNFTFNAATGGNRVLNYAGKIGGFTANLYEDFSFFKKGLLASGKDEGDTGGGQAGFTFNNGSSITAGTEIFSGKPLYPREGMSGNEGYNKQPSLKDYNLNNGTTFLKLNNFQNVGNLRLDYSGQSQMWSQNAVHNMFGYKLFQSTATNSFQVTK